METLNIACNQCNTGKVAVLDLVHDDYKLGCTNSKCTNISWVHYTGYDSLFAVSEYNNLINEDVQMLSAHGVWTCKAGKDTIFRKNDNFDIDAYSVGKKLIQKLDLSDVDNEIMHFFMDGLNFYQVQENTVHSSFTIYKYEAKEESLPSLAKHFLNITL